MHLLVTLNDHNYISIAEWFFITYNALYFPALQKVLICVCLTTGLIVQITA